jgi:hypothetical protein
MWYQKRTMTRGKIQRQQTVMCWGSGKFLLPKTASPKKDPSVGGQIPDHWPLMTWGKSAVSLKVHVLKVWSSVWLYWKVIETFKRWGLVGSFLGHWSCVLEGDSRMPVSLSLSLILSLCLSLILCRSFRLWREENYSTCTSAMMCPHKPKAMGPTNHGQKELKPWDKINLSSS